MNTNANEIALAIANIEATSELLDRLSADPRRNLSFYASDLLERMSFELHKLAGDLSEINYNYVS